MNKNIERLEALCRLFLAATEEADMGAGDSRRSAHRPASRVLAGACTECGKNFTRDKIVEEKPADGETAAACEECRALTEKEIWQTEQEEQ
jgi:hypothetical protein